MNYKKHTLLLVSAVVLLSAGIAGVAMAQSVLFDKDIDLQGTKKVLNAMNVGIGTASPDGKLQVDVSQAGATIGAEGITLKNTATDGQYSPSIYFRQSLWPTYIGRLYSKGGYDFYLQGTTDGSTWSNVAEFSFGTAYLNASKVGIGTTDPSYQLDVNGYSRFTQPVTVGTPSAVNHAATKQYVDTAFASAGQWTTSGSNIYMNLSGNVGIGTTAPAHKLDIAGSYYSRTVSKGTCSGTVAINWNDGNTQHCVLGSTPVTFTFSGGQSGGNYKLILKQDGTGSRTVSWPASIRWGSGSAPYLTPVPAKTDYVGFIYNGVDGTYDSVAFNANF